MVSFGLEWFRTEWNCLVLRGLSKSCIVLNGIVYCMVMKSLIWSFMVCMILCGLVWFSIAYANVFPCKVSNCLVFIMYGLVWPYAAMHNFLAFRLFSF